MNFSQLENLLYDTLFIIAGDETFNEVFRDFTSMAHNAPEKLNRNK